jgi:phosphoglycolate phosphatase-like HAD superfamily hydrolase
LVAQSHDVKLAVDLDGALADTRPLWRDWLGGAKRVLGVDATTLADDRAAAAEQLDRAGAGNWRVLLERFAADRAPVYLRPRGDVSAALRHLGATGARVAVFTDAPVELARLALAHAGVDRRVESLHTGEGAEARALEALGDGAAVVRDRAGLVDAAASVR